MNKQLKNSGIEWVGEVPHQWKTGYLNQYFIQIKNKNINLQETNLLSLSYGKIIQKDINSKEGLLPEKFDGYNIIKSGDIVLRLTDLQNDHKSLRVGWSSQKGIITSAYITLRRKSNEIHDKFAYYFLHSFDLSKGFYGMGSGVRQGLTYDGLKKMEFVFPLFNEQQKIVNFLDKKVLEIDILIEKTKLSIEELKKYKQALITEMVLNGLNTNIETKNTGVEWIGDIPNHWKLGRIKLVTSKIGSGKTPRGGASVYSNSGILFIRSQNVYETGLYLNEATYISEDIDEEMKNTRVFPNDVLLNITGGSIGRNCVYPDYMETHANVNQHVCIIRCIQEKILPKYMSYFLSSNAGQTAIKTYQTGGNREGLNFEQIGKIPIPILSIAEQKDIVNLLDEKCSHINGLVEQKLQLVIELEEYKKSLIYEYVTGKKEVK
ncbi:restriction endonuclease subunit S [Cytobacillus firmus]|uniref:restriction endonuclease subunit S n=1 Tax=Cytobacillus firmus TaxID=1399 RepID=UPI0036B6C38B